MLSRQTETLLAVVLAVVLVGIVSAVTGGAVVVTAQPAPVTDPEETGGEVIAEQEPEPVPESVAPVGVPEEEASEPPVPEPVPAGGPDV